MKRMILCMAAAALLFARCGKSDNGPSVCSVSEQKAHPNNDSARLFIPNAFTPNGDGLNDRFGPMTVQIDSIDFTVYDSNNIPVFHTDQVGQYWQPPAMSDPAQYKYQVAARAKGGDRLSWCGTVEALPCFPAYIHFDELIFGDQFDPNMPEGYLLGASGEQYIPCE